MANLSRVSKRTLDGGRHRKMFKPPPRVSLSCEDRVLTLTIHMVRNNYLFLLLLFFILFFFPPPLPSGIGVGG
jgi:hypothetical protein